MTGEREGKLTLLPRAQINQGKGGSGSTVSRLVTLAKQTGPIGLFDGLGPRMVRRLGLLLPHFARRAELSPRPLSHYSS